MRTIDDRDTVHVHTGNTGRRYGAPWRLLGGTVGIIALLTLCVILFGQLRATFDPLEREARREALYAEQDRAQRLQWVDDIVGVAWRLLPVGILAGASAVGLVLLYNRYGRVASVMADFQVRAVAARYQIEAPHTYSPHITGGSSRAELPQPNIIDTPALHDTSPVLPGITDLARLNYTPSNGAVLLGLGAGGELITAPINKLWHVATAGPTGNGKSNIQRLLLAQLCALGAQVCIGDTKWTSYDAEQDEDWRPIESRLHMRPASDAQQIGALLNYATEELVRRLELRRDGHKAGKPLFIALDELPWIFDHVKGSAESITELIRVGRGVNVLVLAAAQDFLSKSVGLSAARDNFRSAFYTGGDLTTGSVLLDIPQRELRQREHELTLGIALLRSTCTREPALVRVPYVSNEALYKMLGEPEARLQNGYQVATGNAIDVAENMRKSSHFVASSAVATSPLESDKTASAEAARVHALFLAGKDLAAIVKEIRGISSDQGGKYQKALTEVQGLLREGVKAAKA